MEDTLRLKLLADLAAERPDTVGVLASWFFQQWGRHVPGVTLESEIAKVSSYDGRDAAPLMIVAERGGAPVGAAGLKIREMSIYPEFEHWLGSVFVKPEERARGIASCLVKAVLARARDLGISELYLQTEDLSGGLYARHGFKPMERVLYRDAEVLVMRAEPSRDDPRSSRDLQDCRSSPDVVA